MIDTCGYKGWWPMKFFEGKTPDGSKVGTEGFRNVVNGQEVMPEKGWNGSPPYRTGELNMHISPLYRERYDQINWNK